MWQDPRFERLGIRHVRLLVYYNLVPKGDFSRYDAWMRQAQARGDDVLLDDQPALLDVHPRAADAPAVPARRARAPSPLSVGAAASAAWNEANHKSSPCSASPAGRRSSTTHARRVPRLHDRRRRRARLEHMLPWLANSSATRGIRGSGFHSYTDTNHFRPLRATSTRRCCERSGGEVWLTETDGSSASPTVTTAASGPSAARRAAVRRTFRVAAISPRVKRVYLYHWDADRRPPHSGLGLRARERKAARWTCCGASSTGSAFGAPSRRSGASRAIRASCR